MRKSVISAAVLLLIFAPVFTALSEAADGGLPPNVGLFMLQAAASNHPDADVLGPPPRCKRPSGCCRHPRHLERQIPRHEGGWDLH